jgi:hypothetical protein
MTGRIRRQHREALDHNERPPDPAEAADRPLERKERDPPDPGPDRDRDPHHVLNRPVGERDETADSDPYGD